jgi:putative zinc finger/helix-turn-helix YgiT family protein
MKATKNSPCPCCGEGILRSLSRDYLAKIGEGQTIKVPNIQMEVCDKCGEEILSLEAARDVDSAIAEYTDRLTPEELTAIRKEFGVDQTEISEALGLGGKTYHRWEKGSQYPSRSMGYYLRVLREYPEVFAWLRGRGWQARNRVTTIEKSPLLDMESRFRALAGNPSRLNSLATDRRNYALALFDKK